LAGEHKDFSSYGPGGLNFGYTQQENTTVGSAIDEEKQSKIKAGPNEYGFTFIKQKNFVPIEKGMKEKKKK
jgi:hypothetical protein